MNLNKACGPYTGRNVLRLVLLVALAAGMMGCPNGKTADSADQYTCPMHPTVVQNKPGACPVCGMDLVLQGRPGEEVKITAELNYLLKPTNAVVISSIRTITPEKREMMVSVNSSGTIDYDTRRFTAVPIRFGGRIEKMFVRYSFQPVKRGQKILEIYSPELLTAQRDLLYLWNTDRENTRLVEGAKIKLKLLGISETQIDQLLSSGKEMYSLAVFSPADGYITELKVQGTGIAVSSPSPSGGQMGGAMSGDKPSATQGTPLPDSELGVREGMYVNTGQDLFTIVNTEHVWATFDLYPEDGALIHVGDAVKISLENAEGLFQGTVNFVEPFFKRNEKFARVRVHLPNQGNKMRIGQLANAQFESPSGMATWIPISSRLELGTKSIVFNRRRGVFRPKEVVTARRSGQWIEVVSGVEPGDSLAYNAQFMVDSEGFIKVKN
ncbi:MAG: efflux RND transporter periplasmic adaptor subunit [Cytophagales bacterium]|nr:efflux RND transporter periplasmic adaptor subunit [Cytophagales bacterium]